MTGAIILAVTSAVVVGLGAFVVSWGRRWNLPEGQRMEGNYLGHRVTLIYDRDGMFPFHPGVIANAVALASWSLSQTWKGYAKTEGPKWIVVHVTEDANYDRMYDVPQSDLKLEDRINELLLSTGRNFGGPRIPLLCCRASIFRQSVVNGGPVIHELNHYMLGTVFLDHDYGHEAEGAWGALPSTLEGESRDRYIKHRFEVGVKV